MLGESGGGSSSPLKIHEIKCRERRPVARGSPGKPGSSSGKTTHRRKRRCRVCRINRAESVSSSCPPKSHFRNLGPGGGGAACDGGGNSSVASNHRQKATILPRIPFIAGDLASISTPRGDETRPGAPPCRKYTIARRKTHRPFQPRTGNLRAETFRRTHPSITLAFIDTGSPLPAAPYRAQRKFPHAPAHFFTRGSVEGAGMTTDSLNRPQVHCHLDRAVRDDRLASVLNKHQCRAFSRTTCGHSPFVLIRTTANPG